jgi:hypothetical protein
MCKGLKKISCCNGFCVKNPNKNGIKITNKEWEQIIECDYYSKKILRRK